MGKSWSLAINHWTGKFWDVEFGDCFTPLEGSKLYFSDIDNHNDLFSFFHLSRHTLEIRCAYPEDTGVYTARVTNGSWVHVSQASLTVQENFSPSKELAILTVQEHFSPTDKLVTLNESLGPISEKPAPEEGFIEEECLSLDVQSEGEGSASQEPAAGQRSKDEDLKMLKKRITSRPGGTAVLECPLDLEHTKPDVKIKWYVWFA